MKKNRGRTSGTRNQKKNILIVCEGTTEEIYLKGLKSKYRLATVSITVKESSGGSAIKVFELAKEKSLKLMKNFDVPKNKSELSMNPYTNMALLIKKFEDESNI